MSLFGVLLVRIFPHSDWIRTRKTSNTDTFHVVKFLAKADNFNSLDSNLQKKDNSGPKQKTWISTTDLPYSNSFRYQISLWTKNFEFLYQVFLKKVFWSKAKKFSYRKQKSKLIIVFCIFELVWEPNLTLNKQLWIKSAKKRSFLSKTEKVNMRTKFCILELVWVSNFTLIQQFWIFGVNLRQKGT